MMSNPDALKNFLLYFFTLFFRFLELALMAHIILSWVSQKATPLRSAINSVIVPLLRPFSFAIVGGLDFSPIMLYFTIGIAQKLTLDLISFFFR